MDKKKKSLIIKIVIILLFVGAFVFIKPLREGFKDMSKAFKSMETVRDYIKSFGPWAVVISFLMMVVQSVAAPIPAFFITLANAVIWGWVKGAILSWTSAMAGAALCFWIARFYGREAAEIFATKMALDDVEKFFEKYGSKTILVARLLPFVPFDPISYAAGLTPMGFWQFFIATGIGQLPATIVYSYAAAKSSNPGTFVKGLLLLFGLVGLVYLMKIIYTEVQKNKEKKKTLSK